MLLAAQEAAASSAPWILDNVWIIPGLPALSFLLMYVTFGALALRAVFSRQSGMQA